MTTPSSHLQNPLWVRASGGWVAGVFKGIAENFGIEVWILRAAFLVSFFCFGFGLVLYFMLAISLPKKEELEGSLRRRVLGVCKDLAIKYDFEVGLVRFAMCMLALSSLGLALVLYVVLYFVMPKENNSVSGPKRY